MAEAAVPDHDDAWVLDVAYTLTAPADRSVTLGSPATNGRPGGAGYGGFFWRVAPGAAETFTATARGEEAVNALVFSGLGQGDHWFVRTGIYPGVCVALAFGRTLPIPAGTAMRRWHRVVVADGALDRWRAAALAQSA